MENIEDKKIITKETIIKEFELFSHDDSFGIECIFSQKGRDDVFKILGNISQRPIRYTQLNQIFVLSGLPGFSKGFFEYYWMNTPEEHPYVTTQFNNLFNNKYSKLDSISELNHLKWGLYRIYVDGLLFFGDINRGYGNLCRKNKTEISEFFKSKRFDTNEMTKRPAHIDYERIDQEDRYLISEMVAATYSTNEESSESIYSVLKENYHKLKLEKPRKKKFKIKELLDYSSKNKQLSFELSTEEIMEDEIKNDTDIDKKIRSIADRFKLAREKALKNTHYYLSLVNDMDVYVATSMRNKKDFISMAQNVERIFKRADISELKLNYFDPTISASTCTEDKGILECLMVKCAKALIYTAGDKESYGKDAEAAMSLSSGKPVIFFCPERDTFYRNNHPLTKLVDFTTGIANGAMITNNTSTISDLLQALFTNNMQYKLEQGTGNQKGFFRLKEKTTDSTIRIQTNDKLLVNTFWNFYTNINNPLK
ncbi:MAG: hypothetical protein LBL74_07285 [Bacteroidales bacterium]|jgi:hypothetical protein|nr:hypothetical protein [Bacteroidales bacterium]